MNRWHRTNSESRGYGAAWRKLRLRVLRRDKYICRCEQCQASGRIRLATEVDHKIPKARGGTDTEDNLQAINAECHRLKTIRDAGGTPKPKIKIGLDGFPIE